MKKTSPPESVHALDIEALCEPNITFWSAAVEQTLVGCGALKELTAEHAEIKSMRTASNYLRQGVAATLVKHILEVAAQRGYKKLSLETGSMDYFKPARQLYKKFGFDYCPAFDEYSDDPNSLFMTKPL